MPTVMIRCPKTKKTFPTPIGMDKATFENATMTGSSVQCPHCGAMHPLSKKDAFLADD